MNIPHKDTSIEPGEDSGFKSPAACSTPALPGGSSESPRPVALPGDSKVKQAFFPDDFSMETAERNVSSPICDNNNNAKHSVEVKHPSSWRLTMFLVFWMFVFLVIVVVQAGAERINDIQQSILDLAENVAVGYIPYILLGCLFVVSFIAVCNDYLKSLESPSMNISGRKDKLSLSPVPDFARNVAGKSEEYVKQSSRDFPCRRTFSGTGSDAWNDFRRYFENLTILNNWSKEESRRTLLCSLRGQAEAYAYGLPQSVQNDWDLLFSKLEDRFGILNMKDSYVADARLRRKQKTESYREYGQAIEDLYRKAYPDNTEIVGELAVTTFLENCHDSVDFRLAVKRTRPRSLQDAITAAIQEECLRQTEREKQHKQDFKGNRVYYMPGKRNRYRNFRNYRNTGVASSNEGRQGKGDQDKNPEN